MKKLSKISSAIAIALVIVSCNKEDINSSNQMNNSQIDYTLDKIPFITNTQDVNVLMKNPNDKDGEKLNIYLYEIGLATRELIENSKFNAVILRLAEESGTQTAYLLDLKSEAPEFYNQINRNLAEKGLSLEQISDDMTHVPLTGNPEFPETMETEKYEPAIFIPNLKNVDKSKQPLLSPNVETDCSKNPEIEDFVVTWYYNQAGELYEIILGEETSLVTSNPLFLIDHAIPRKKGNNMAVAGNSDDIRPSEEDQDRVIDYFESREIQIKTGYRHEEGINVKSEFCVSTHRMWYNNGSPYAYPIFTGSYLKIKEIHPNDLDVDHYAPAYHCDNWTPYSQNRIYWNTYERDWNRSPKDLINAPYPSWGITCFFQDRMRYSEDWYAWIPSTTNIHNTPLDWFGWETSVRFENWKSAYEVHRVE